MLDRGQGPGVRRVWNAGEGYVVLSHVPHVQRGLLARFS